MVVQETHCAHCGDPLTGRQRRTCSPRCRKAVQRSAPALRTCKLCRQPFQPSGPGRQSICPYDDADDFCQGLQDDQEDAEAARLAAREEAVCEGPECSSPLPYAGRGRPPRFCSSSCRTRAYRREARS
ncbi:hypothetical protein [Streptomyces viridochromogenes]|uniref:hypothetical protein n=1 Tax=Streptomyces viridochromogenes TaxID=1938 RepID=UPI00069D9F0B|nr:hypothetical protein [Streptomyces viridochromogenes]KOG21990.1 hypothetical protein ADK36_13690 [Streptomyces viridochromogenes]